MYGMMAAEARVSVVLYLYHNHKTPLPIIHSSRRHFMQGTSSPKGVLKKKVRWSRATVGKVIEWPSSYYTWNLLLEKPSRASHSPNWQIEFCWLLSKIPRRRTQCCWSFPEIYFQLPSRFVYVHLGTWQEEEIKKLKGFFTDLAFFTATYYASIRLS